jgi:glyoxylate/hydroxypyruvate reductase A
MKEGAYFVNVGRGSVVDEDALVAALDAGRPAGAALDVFRTEPLPSASPLWRHPRVRITPHMAGGAVANVVAEVAENYRRLLAGEPLLNVADPERGY